MFDFAMWRLLFIDITPSARGLSYEADIFVHTVKYYKWFCAFYSRKMLCMCITSNKRQPIRETSHKRSCVASYWPLDSLFKILSEQMRKEPLMVCFTGPFLYESTGNGRNPCHNKARFCEEFHCLCGKHIHVITRPYQYIAVMMTSL